MSTNLDALIAQAQAQAATLPAAPLPTLAPAAAAQVPAMAYNMDIDSFLNSGGMEVDSYLQVKDAGIKLNKDWSGYIEEFEAIVDLSEVAVFMGIRKEVGSNVTYAKTYDGRTTTRGEPFAAIVAQFKQESQKPADPYRGADIPLRLVADVSDPKDKSKVMRAEQVVGLSTSITGFKPWATFHKKLLQAGHGSSTIKVKVKHSARRNAANQDYGVCEFELLEVVDGVAAAAA